MTVPHFSVLCFTSDISSSLHWLGIFFQHLFLFLLSFVRHSLELTEDKSCLENSVLLVSPSWMPACSISPRTLPVSHLHLLCAKTPQAFASLHWSCRMDLFFPLCLDSTNAAPPQLFDLFYFFSYRVSTWRMAIWDICVFLGLGNLPDFCLLEWIHWGQQHWKSVHLGVEQHVAMKQLGSNKVSMSRIDSSMLIKFPMTPKLGKDDSLDMITSIYWKVSGLWNNETKIL